MRHKSLTQRAWALLVLLFAGCVATAPVYNVADAPVTALTGALTDDQVQVAIIRAGSSLGWQVEPVAPGHLVGTLNLRKHTAIVDIMHSASKYSITYKDSRVLKYKDNMIHRNYNNWIHNLDREIKAQISLM